MKAIKSKLLEIILAIAILAVVYFAVRYAIPHLWYQGSSSAFDFMVFLIMVCIVLIGCALFLLFGKKKPVRAV